MRINNLFITVCIGLSLVLSAPSMAKESSAFSNEFVKEKTFLEKYLPWLVLPTKKVDIVDPRMTMQSPFYGDSNDTDVESRIMDLYDSQNRLSGNNISGLNVAHISHSEIENWISEAVSTSFNFSLSDMNSFRSTLQPYYSDQGISEFKKLLLSMNTIAIMKSNNKKIASYVTDTPILKKQGVNNGTYTWLYDSYVIVSYIDNTVDSKRSSAINRKYRIRVQVSQTLDKKRHITGVKIDKVTAKKLKIEEGIL